MAAYTHGPGIDDPLIMRYEGADYFYHKNHLGSIMEMTDINQNTVKTYDYDAYGNIIGESGLLPHNAFTYTARELHTRSGLYYYRARFYDPEIGRFITQDPTGLEGGENLYGYAGSDPANWIDPLGLVRMTTTRSIKIPRWLQVSGLELYLGPRNYRFFKDFFNGTGETRRNYAPCSQETTDMAASPGAEALRKWFYSGNTTKFEYGTWRAFAETAGNPKSTAFQVAGFLGEAIDNGDGTVTFVINNEAGTKSFFGEGVFHLGISNRTAQTGRMRTIYQTFTWTEPIR